MRLFVATALAVCLAAPVAWAQTTTAGIAQGLPPTQTLATCSASLVNGAWVYQSCPPGVGPADPNNAAFSDWPVYALGTSYTVAQLAGVRSVVLQLTAAGTATMTSAAGNTMALSVSSGLTILPFIPTSIVLSNSAAGNAWMLK